jgi:hypothetical protein
MTLERRIEKLEKHTVVVGVIDEETKELMSWVKERTGKLIE